MRQYQYRATAHHGAPAHCRHGASALFTRLPFGSSISTAAAVFIIRPPPPRPCLAQSHRIGRPRACARVREAHAARRRAAGAGSVLRAQFAARSAALPPPWHCAIALAARSSRNGARRGAAAALTRAKAGMSAADAASWHAARAHGVARGGRRKPCAATREEGKLQRRGSSAAATRF